MTDAMIRMKGVTLDLGRRRILESIDLEIAPGESVGLIGPNGSGKTSILRCLLGLVPFRGSASIDGHDVVRDPIDARRKTAFLPQRASFGDALAGEHLAFVAKLRGLDRVRERVESALAQVGLADQAKRRARDFSGGMQQRLSLASVILVDAPVLLLDEPTASLDREGQTHFLRVVESLRAEGRTLVLASHRPEEVARLTDRVIVMDHGVIDLNADRLDSPANVVVPLFSPRVLQ